MQFRSKSTLSRFAISKIVEVNEHVDESISKAALQKFCHHLWYLSDQVLSLFEDEVEQLTKSRMVANLNKGTVSTTANRYIPSKEDLCGSLQS